MAVPTNQLRAFMVRDFLQFLKTIEDGEALSSLNHSLAQVWKAVYEAAERGEGEVSGTIVHTIKISKIHGKPADISSKQRLSVPGPRDHRTVLYATEQGEMCTTNPARGEFIPGLEPIARIIN